VNGPSDALIRLCWRFALNGRDPSHAAMLYGHSAEDFAEWMVGTDPQSRKLQRAVAQGQEACRRRDAAIIRQQRRQRRRYSSEI
jgi:hypothetical protein